MRFLYKHHDNVLPFTGILSRDLVFTLENDSLSSQAEVMGNTMRALFRLKGHLHGTIVSFQTNIKTFLHDYQEKTDEEQYKRSLSFKPIAKQSSFILPFARCK